MTNQEGSGKMNGVHRWMCRSAYWRKVLEQKVMPRVLSGVELGEEVLEVGHGCQLNFSRLSRKWLNATWIEERMAAELLLKVGIRVSARTVRRYVPDGTGSGNRPSSQRWTTFVRTHAQSILASDFLMAVTASFRILYVLVVMEIGTRGIVHFNVTNHPKAEWTLQQFLEIIQGKEMTRVLIHDRDSSHSAELDLALKSMGLKILKTPVRASTAND